MATDTVDESRTCRKCGKTQPIENFYRNKRGRLWSCKKCCAEYSHKNKDRAAERARINYALNPQPRRDAVKRYALRNPEKVKARWAAYGREHGAARARRYAEKNPEKVRETQQRTRAKNHHKILAATRDWRKRNPEKVKAYQRVYGPTRTGKRREQYAANPIPHRERRKRYDKDNPEMHKVHRFRRRARKHNAVGDYTIAEAQVLLERQQHLCANPHCCVDLRTVLVKCLDHIVALAKGGSNFITNMQWLCRPCNSRKTTLSQEEWLLRECKRSAKAG